MPSFIDVFAWPAICWLDNLLRMAINPTFVLRFLNAPKGYAKIALALVVSCKPILLIALIIRIISGQSVEAQNNNVTIVQAAPSSTANADAPMPVQLETGSNQPLSSVSIPLEILPWELAPMLLFDFGFLTEEPPAQGTLHDSFSITLGNAHQTNAAILLSADAYGVTFAPITPGGITLALDSIIYREVPFPNSQSNALISVAYSVAVILPREFAGFDAALYLDLFDNQDGLDSVGFADRLRVESGLPPIYLQSSTKAGGPYADEMITSLDRRLRTITVPKYGKARFYRAKANVPVIIRLMRPQADRVVFHYEFPQASPGTPTPQVYGLESSAQSGGPYTEETGVTLQPSEKTITLWRAREKRFYRIRADVQRRIVQYRIQGENLIISYE